MKTKTGAAFSEIVKFLFGRACILRFTKSWNDSMLKDVRMVRVTTGKISQESALQAFESGTPSPSIPLNSQDNILLRTSKNTFVRVKVLELNGSGRTAAAVLNVASSPL